MKRNAFVLLSIAVSAVAAGLILCILATAASAAPTPREAARAKVSEGAKLLAEGKSAAALTSFEEALAIFPSPKIFFNVGLAYRALGKNAQAVGAFGRFLREATDAAPDNVEQARAEFERLSKLVAFVAIACDVDGADTFVDGVAVGTTPISQRVPVDAGAHDLVVRSREFGSQSRSFSASAGELVSLELKLRPAASTPIPPMTPPVASAAEPLAFQSPGLVKSAAEPSHGPSGLSVARWVVAGSAAAALGAGIYFNVRSAAKRDEVGQDGCVDAGGGRFDGPANCVSLADDFDTAKQRSVIGYVAGGALAATSVVLFILHANAESGLQPGTQASLLGATYSRRF